MDFPLRCQECQKEVWIDLGRPNVTKLDNLTILEWYPCECGGKIPLFFYTRVMEDALTKLKNMNVHNPSFRYHLAKLIKRSEEIRVRYGSIKHPN